MFQLTTKTQMFEHTIITVENSMVDIHTHILPNIDDGASSFEESLDMLRMMVENGITTVVATPHFSFDKNDIDVFTRKRDELSKELRFLAMQEKLNIQILTGAELMFTPNLDNYDLNDLTIEGTDYILIELSTRRNEPDLEYTLSAIIASGYIPILAHIERYSYLLKNSQRLVNLIEMGVIMQINAKSFSSRNSYRLIKKMISHNLVHILGSDSHDMNERIPNLEISTVDSIFIENQKSIIGNSEIKVKKPMKLIHIFNKYF